MVYLLKRKSDGKLYIGITIERRFKIRMDEHRRSERFKDSEFDIEILEHSKDRKFIEEREEFHIKRLKTFESGLNESPGGKGWGHNDPKFTTREFKFSEESRRKMSISGKLRAAREGHEKRVENTKKAWANPEYVKRQIEVKKGKRLHKPLISDERVDEMRKHFDSVKNDLEQQAKIRSERNLKLGRFPVTAYKLFGEQYFSQYPEVTQATIVAIVANKRRLCPLPALYKF
jgi:predicted GIY-YIG superfamily endonuclease